MFRVNKNNLRRKTNWNLNKYSNLDKSNLKTCRTILKTKYKIILRSICLMFCLMGFLFQTTQLLSLFFSGKTSVDNRVERLKHSELPAITVCLPTFVSMDRFAEYLLKNSTNQTLPDLYREYQDLKTGKNVENYQETYLRLATNFTRDIFHQLDISLIDIFDKVSVHSLNISHFEATALNEKNDHVHLTKPLLYQSLVPFTDPRKCFTFFSGFDKNYDGQKFKLAKMKIQLTHNMDNFPVEMYNRGDFHLALHSPNNMPDYFRGESFLSLKMGGYYAISYREQHIQLLPAPYNTDCRVYPMNYSAQNQMRSDCIERCCDHKMLKRFPKLNCIYSYYNYKLIRKDYLSDIKNLPLCKNFGLDDEPIWKIYQAQVKFETECGYLCKDNCQETFYEFTVNKIRTRYVQKILVPLNENELQFTLKHNRFADQIITHKPIMLWIELLSHFGGLLSMWLGLSIALVFDYFIKII